MQDSATCHNCLPIEQSQFSNYDSKMCRKPSYKQMKAERLAQAGSMDILNMSSMCRFVMGSLNNEIKENS